MKNVGLNPDPCSWLPATVSLPSQRSAAALPDTSSSDQIPMERIGHKYQTLAEAAEAERLAMWAMSPEERLAIARELQLRVYGRDCPDVRVGRLGKIVRQP